MQIVWAPSILLALQLCHELTNHFGIGAEIMRQIKRSGTDVDPRPSSLRPDTDGDIIRQTEKAIPCDGIHPSRMRSTDDTA